MFIKSTLLSGNEWKFRVELGGETAQFYPKFPKYRKLGDWVGFAPQSPNFR